MPLVSLNGNKASTTQYNRTTPIPYSIGGLEIGLIPKGTISNLLDKLLYPTTNLTFTEDIVKEQMDESTAMLGIIAHNNTANHEKIKIQGIN